MPASTREPLLISHAQPPAPGALGSLPDFAAHLLSVPLAIITPMEGRSFCSRAADGDGWTARRGAALAQTLCHLPASSGRPLLIEDARAHPAVRGRPELWMGEAAYAGVPVRTPDGRVLGTFCAIDARPRRWAEADVRALGQLAEMAALLLERHAATGSAAGFVGAIGTARGRLSLRMLEKAVETMQIGVTITDTAGRILYSNPAEARMHGYEVDELRGMHARIFAPPENARPMQVEAMQDASSWSRETVNVRKDGSTFPVLLRSDVVTDSRGRPVGLVTCCEDVTERRELERQLLRSAFYEPVTGLPNRGLFAHRVEMAVDRERRGEADFAVIAVALDRLQLVSDSLGRPAADELLAAVAARLRECVRPDALLAHVARDEFAVLLDEIDGIAEPSRVAACLQEQLSRPVVVQGTEVFPGGSVGIALSYTGYERAEDVLRDAVIALYRSRDARQGQYEVFDRDMHAQVMARLRMETDLRRALERGELRVHYQPIVSLASGRISGFEALARWDHPVQGMIQPDDFIPLAEETGLIRPIGMWVLEEACRELRRWQDAHTGDGAPTMAVNLSAGQFLQADLVEQVERVLRETAIEPGTLKLEITESVLMQHTERVTDTLHRLKALGVQLHIDDFGTGYSSLGYLHRLPLDALKIDRSFVSEAEGANLQLVRTIVALAHALGVAVITEGIESAELLRELRALECEFGQGFLFSRPLASGEIEALVASDPCW
ncbi:MAG TPA: EAL domain-containing protein [Longimicrobium sp.]|nr:EAL domain-containing protein [Longimicrobium sp.]